MNYQENKEIIKNAKLEVLDEAIHGYESKLYCMEDECMVEKCDSAKCLANYLRVMRGFYE